MKKIEEFFSEDRIKGYKDALKRVTGSFKIDKIKTETGRVFIRGSKLNLEKTKFKPGVRFNVYPNPKRDKLAIVIAEDGKYRVTPGGVLDIRDSIVKDMLKGAEISLVIYDDCIIAKRKSPQSSIACSSEAIVESKVISFKKKEERVLDINADESQHSVILKMVAGGSGPMQNVQMSLFDQCFESNSNISTQSSYPIARETKEVKIGNVFKPISFASFFCGMGGLDYAFKTYKQDNEKVFDEIFALDKSFHMESAKNVASYGKEACSPLGDFHIKNFKRNIGEHIVDADFLTYPIEQIPDFEVGSFTIPCVELSSVSPSRNKFKMLPKFVDRFIEIIKDKKDKCKVFVLENSSNMITAGRVFLDKIKKELPWFDVTEHSFDAADFGAAQHRDRAIVVGSTIGKIEIKKPVVALVKTVRQALKNLHDDVPNQGDYSVPGEDTKHRMSFVRQGSNWRDIPEEFRTKGQFANYFRRLHLDETSIAIANVRKSIITHPLENRTLSVRECLRLFGLPDTFVLEGPLAAMQQMVCNSVPLELSSAIAKTIGEACVSYRNRTQSHITI